MDLTPYVTALQNDLAVAAEAGGPEARAIAERLTAPLDSAVRLALLDALSAAANEITRDLAPGSVDLRLRGREPGFVVTPPPAPAAFDEAAAPREAPTAPSTRPADVEDGPMTRINLRLSQDLKDRVEDAARAAGLSVNAWLVRAATSGLDENTTTRRPERRAPTGGDRFTGWVR
ncbi:hypothetical protein M2284_000502 [Rhodococcus sp. LBL1]|uniref:Toxin-antitoxin system HicB family antitoxin n=1 Tax=Prescottella agglutinans TaxID=1644129 RepID=A0ABT6MAX4_9NOCA|nr:hypothetical protein [Prescottella agglutinans]MDH6281045.1 hypothetical protein [Prescottella agglutinans]MDH6676314.1 hypothetical protein [Rhodococcus sp. LBL1]MDH6681600.1 hypothetical protein [Rhodococcus sp. LBL2]